MISLCVTTFKRQDLLPLCLATAFAGSVRPDKVYLIDQAGQPDLLKPALVFVTCPYEIVDLGEGCRGGEADAINWYLQHVPEERVVAHEDVTFGPKSLERFLACKDPFVIDSTQGVLTYRNTCVDAVGLYDPVISPQSFLFCDVDYEDRLAMVSIHPTVAACGITHLRNGTLKVAGDDAAFWEKARLAELHYVKAWNRPVTEGGDTVGRAQWRRAHMDEVRGWTRRPALPTPSH